MRVGPFSNKQVTDYIQAHFVPVYLSNEDYKSGKFGTKEQQLLRDIRRKTEAKGIRAGSVQVYPNWR
jgi:thioredoxin-related protein